MRYAAKLERSLNMKRQFELAFLTVLSGLLLAAWGCSGNSSNMYGPSSSPPPINNKPNTVVMAGYAFGPTSMTIKLNTTITFQNSDGVVHTATSDNGAWNTGDIAAGGSKAVTFTTAGTFSYHCTHHPMMTGTIIVQ
jgi:plastocyanin